MGPPVTIAVMARAPIAGRCKTRLAQWIGGPEAAQLYAAMLADRLDAISALPCSRRVLLAAADEEGLEVLRELLPPHWELVVQRGQGVGTRMRNAFRDIAKEGELVCLVDSDSPALPFASLWPQLTKPRGPGEVVVGPCEDGGYYLIGMTSPNFGVFEDIPWSTREVMSATRERCRSHAHPLEELPVAYDVDELADLARLERDLQANPSLAPKTAAVLQLLSARVADDSA